MGFAGGQEKEAQSLELGMGDDAFDQPLAQALVSVGLNDKEVTEPGKGGIIRDDPSKAYLLYPCVEAKAERVLDRLGDDGERTLWRPVGRAAQVVMNEGEIQPGFVGADQIIFASMFDNVHGTAAPCAPCSFGSRT